MGFWSSLKKGVRSAGEAGARAGERVGEFAGKQVARGASTIAEKYRERYAGGEYRARRVAEYERRAEEEKARLDYERARQQRREIGQKRYGAFFNQVTPRTAPPRKKKGKRGQDGSGQEQSYNGYGALTDKNYSQKILGR